MVVEVVEVGVVGVVAAEARPATLAFARGQGRRAVVRYD